VGSLREYWRLAGGGKSLAQMVGARPVAFDTTDPAERRFRQVVEEMAIASGTPVPALYVMDREPGINAFVAGLGLDDTVMVITGGALRNFTRDELQAVVGHEFSHILNADMRLNLRLMMWLGGILALGQLGSFMMRVSGHVRGSDERRGGIIYLIVAGFMIWLIGYIGLFFGRLIKAAISRQREFLADASSVQFTRNPDGLAAALSRIQAQTNGSWLRNLHAEDMSHLCFGETLRFSRLLATHPPLEERIAALGPQYVLRARTRRRELRDAAETAGMRVPDAEPAPSDVPAEKPPLEFVAGAATAMAVPVLMAQVGAVNPAQLACARTLYQRLPARVSRAMQTCRGAEAVLYAMLARHGAHGRDKLATFLASRRPEMQEDACQLYDALDGFELQFALPLTELAMPRLQALAPEAQRKLLEHLQAFARLDGRLSTFEFALLMLLRKQLHLLPAARPLQLADCLPAVSQLVAILLRAGGHHGEDLARLHARLLRTLTPTPQPLPAGDGLRFSRLAVEVGRLAGLPLRDKRLVLELAATAVLADARVALEEYELLRVVAALLDCPMPVLTP
ncbi:MAG: M48 family metallopeptidase, partial [Moraxellaceae bacterium]